GAAAASRLLSHSCARGEGRGIGNITTPEASRHDPGRSGPVRPPRGGRPAPASQQPIIATGGFPMRAAVQRPVHVLPRVGEVPGPGEVVVRVRAAALCASDLSIVAGRIPTVTLPLITGHELAGEVAALGPGVTGWAIGQRVTASLDVTCQNCRYCRTGRTNLC